MGRRESQAEEEKLSRVCKVRAFWLLKRVVGRPKTGRRRPGKGTTACTEAAPARWQVSHDDFAGDAPFHEECVDSQTMHGSNGQDGGEVLQSAGGHGIRAAVCLHGLLHS